VRLPGMDGSDYIRETCRRNLTMASVICTGSPEYMVPEDLVAQRCVSNRLFKKPVADLADMEKEILRLLEDLNKKDGER